MIPRIIHYCWFGPKPIPRKFQRYIDGWRRLSPDFKFVLWNDECLAQFSDVSWVREAYDSGLYAFVADYVRLYAVYTQGGIYLDTDVEMIRPFEDLLDRPYLFGEEYDLHPESGIFGAEPGCELIRWCKEFYEHRQFRPDTLTLSTCKAPQVLHDTLLSRGRSFLVTEVHPRNYPDRVCLLPHDFLTAMNSDTGVAHPSARTRTIHHYAGTWCYPTLFSRVRRFLKVLISHLLGERIVRTIRAWF